MKRTHIAILATLSLAASAALAQTTTTPPSGTPVTGATIQQRKDNQQQRIGNGLENGSLTPKEAGKIETQEKGLNTEERGMRQENGGKLTTADKATLNGQQNKLSNEIYNQKHDAQVQPKATNEVNARDRTQQQRIGQGVKSGSLTAGETANLEKKEAGLNKEEHNDREANGGKLTGAEKTKINRQQNRVSKQIYKDKHNARQRKG
ncbi:MAG TPA: hypothetical protein VHA06_10425 [Candidatus Angelobacter sp.]|nr:hypothetical protein [Candidatus Angelobacter sp.]